MCRRNQLRSYLMMGFGTGLMIGHCVESWLLCVCGGLLFLALGMGGCWKK